MLWIIYLNRKRRRPGLDPTWLSHGELSESNDGNHLEIRLPYSIEGQREFKEGLAQARGRGERQGNGQKGFPGAVELLEDLCPVMPLQEVPRGCDDTPSSVKVLEKLPSMTEK